jgi:8-amino-7-oxononanoate synthase
VPDFTSASYLGLRHASRVLRPWVALTTGRPAAVRPVPGAAAVAQRLAELQGCEAATLLPSTLHAAWDVSALVDPRHDVLLHDIALYPILGATVGLAATRGVGARPFASDAPSSLERALQGARRRPVVLVDGLCPACGGPAPLRDLLAVVRRHDGLLVIDDTQAVGILGILGVRGGAVRAWGQGGGGSLRFHGLTGAPDVLVIASLAKALGVPAASVSGSAAAIAEYEARSGARVHCSPVSSADVRALEHALAVNHQDGETLRRRAADAVRRWRGALGGLRVTADGGSLPMQALPPLRRRDAARLHRRLARAGVLAVPQSWAGGAEGRLVFLLGARTTAGDIDAAAAALARAPELVLLRRGATAQCEVA